MSSPCTLTGGSFQDSEGNVLALGYLTFRLSQDASVNDSNICSGVEIRIALNSSGSVVGGSEIWGNDVLSPLNTYYRVTGYTAAGQPVWGPNNQQVVGSTFDLGTWVPNQVISWNPPPSGVLTLENNGTANSSQTVLNLESTDASVIITDEGGGNINLQAATPSFMTAGQGWFLGGESYAPVAVDTGDFFPANGSVYAVQLSLESKFTIRSMRSFCITGSTGSFTAGLYSDAGTTLLVNPGAGAFSVGASQHLTSVTLGSPITLEPGVYWFAFGALTGANGSVLSHSIPWLVNLLNGVDYFNPQVGITRYGTAANGLSGGGALPATLGAITAFAEGSSSPAVPAIMFVV